MFYERLSGDEVNANNSKFRRPEVYLIKVPCGFEFQKPRDLAIYLNMPINNARTG